MIEDGVRIIGDVLIGENPSICAPAELMAKESSIKIGDHFDCAAFVTISTADSHRRCLGLSDEVERLPIVIGNHVFVGTGAVILGGCVIGDYCVIGANVVLKRARVPSHSLVRVADPVIVPDLYRPTLGDNS